jgi:RND family efflux transporter MFP subunit
VVTPRTAIDLVPEVTGKVVKLHPQFAVGGFFAQGELLLAIDPRDYDIAIAQAEARIAEAKRLVISEEAQAEQARSEWQALGQGKPSPLALHEPQLAEARAKLKAAEADLAKAKLQRSRCELHAPFAGRIHEKHVGLGQAVQVGEKLARLHSTDAAEIRLPLAADQLAFIALPLGREPLTNGPAVTLRATFAGALRHWQGRIVRTDGALDEATGLLHAVAEVREPYSTQDGQPPLLAGLFVQAEIAGLPQAGVYVLPQTAVNASQEVVIVDNTSRLRIRKLEVLRQEPGKIIAKAGLQAGDQIVLSGISLPVEGMTVQIAAESQR